MALDIQEVSTAQNPPADLLSGSVFGQKVGTADRLFFTEQLELLLSTGVNLHEALDALGNQATNPAFKKLLAEISSDVLQGRPFSQSLSKHPEVFSSTYITLIAAAENGGFLHEVLSQLLEMEEKKEELRSTVVGALSYPLFLAVFSLAVVAFILVFVFPKFGKMFVSIQDELPSTTLALMWASDMLRHRWHLILGIVVTAAFFIRAWYLGPAGRRSVDSFKLRMPGLSSIFVSVYLVQALRTMGTSLNNGVSLVDTLSSCKEVVDNTVLRMFLAKVESHVKDGVSFSKAFAEGEFLPPLVVQMITTGDSTGNLGKVMIRIADYYERELGKKLQKLSKIAEPLMLLVMGTMVGILVSSLILPIFKLTRSVG
ncbi:MAG: type II secretion system F family protein [Gammaproteobacteria bacterium]